jgi:hypothetical protein
MTYYTIAGLLIILVFVLVMVLGHLEKRKKRKTREIIRKLWPPLTPPKPFIKTQNFMGRKNNSWFDSLRMFNRMRSRTDYHV